MDMITMHLAFPRTCVEEEKKIFVNVAFFRIFGPTYGMTAVIEL